MKIRACDKRTRCHSYWLCGLFCSLNEFPSYFLLNLPNSDPLPLSGYHFPAASQSSSHFCNWFSGQIWFPGLSLSFSDQSDNSVLPFRILTQLSPGHLLGGFCPDLQLIVNYLVLLIWGQLICSILQLCLNPTNLFKICILFHSFVTLTYFQV